MTRKEHSEEFHNAVLELFDSIVTRFKIDILCDSLEKLLQSFKR